MAARQGDFLLTLQDELQPRVLARENQLTGPERNILTRGFNVTLDELSKINPPADHDVLKYWIGLVLFRVKEEGPKGSINLKYFEYFIWMYSQNPSYKDSLFSLFSTIVTKEIMICKTPSEIKLWMDGALLLVKEGIDITNINDAAYFTYARIIWSRIDDSIHPENYQKLFVFLQDLQIGQSLMLNLETLNVICLNNICRYLERQNDLEGINEGLGIQSQKNFENAQICLGYIQSIKVANERLNDRLKEIAKVVGPPILPNQPVPKYEPNIQRVQIDLTKIVFQETIYANDQSVRFGVVIYKATHPNVPLLAIKEYRAKLNINDLDAINVEIAVLEQLSNLAHESNCFLKYYGRWTSENRVFLVMEYGHFNLMSVITEYKKTGHRLQENDLKRVIYNLITSFAQMEKMNIYHQDIKPHNLLVTENFDIKIIDFSISEIKKHQFEMTSKITGENPVQGTKGYMAPELQDAIDKNKATTKFRKAEADVFSLGLTILQLIICEDLYTLNMIENHTRLMEKVNKVPIEWVKTLLMNMLALDYHKRDVFGKLVRFIPFGVSGTLGTLRN